MVQSFKFLIESFNRNPSKNIDPCNMLKKKVVILSWSLIESTQKCNLMLQWHCLLAKLFVKHAALKCKLMLGYLRRSCQGECYWFAHIHVFIIFSIISLPQTWMDPSWHAAATSSPSRLNPQAVGIVLSPFCFDLHLMTSLLRRPFESTSQILIEASLDEVKNSSLILGCQQPDVRPPTWPLFVLMSMT